MTVGVYARISLDRHDGEGVARQLADCHELAATRGWTDIVEYVDNDISAFRRKKRPQYDQMLADLRAGRLTAVVAYHSDRLYRRLTDLETFIDAVQSAGAEVATVKAGDVDLSTASGRMMAGILGSVSKHESERIGERVSRAKRERAAQGRPAGGGMRPFGLTADRTELVEAEADALQAAAEAILAGATWASQVNRLNTDGIRNTGGSYWSTKSLRRVLSSPHVAGLRTYHGQIVGDAQWPAILDRGTWELLRADIDTRRRPGRPPSDRHLLTGLLTCSICGRPLWAKPTRTGAIEYACSPRATTRGRGCGRISISARPAEAHVISVVEGWLADPDFAEKLDVYLAYGDIAHAETKVDLDEIDRQQVVLAQRWASGLLGDDPHDAAQAVLAERRRAAENKLAGARPRLRLAVTAADLLAAWTEAPIPERRELIRLLAHTPIVVGPGLDTARQRVAVEIRLADLRPLWDD